MDYTQFSTIRRDLAAVLIVNVIAVAFFAILGYGIEYRRLEELKQPCTEQTK